MTKLNALRSQLASLRRWRAFVRRTTALSAPLTAVLWILAVIFALDVAFEMDVVQRLIVMAVGVGAMAWAYARYSIPLLGVRETDTEMALMVEKQHRINSDLVASLQFESPEAPEWGSRQLEDAVIERVAGMSRDLDVFEGFSREQMARRMLLLLTTAAVIGAAVYLFPEFGKTFARRLLLGATHYPSATKIEHVIINNRSVLVRGRDASSPVDAKSPESHPLTFLVRCSGQLPDRGKAKLRSAVGRKRPIELERLTLNQRQSRLEETAARIRQAIQDRDVDITGPWNREIATLLRFDAPDATALVEQAGDDPTKLVQAADHIDKLLASWPGDAGKTAIYTGRLSRLVDTITYQLYLGDAWTDPAEVEMIPLPVIEPRLSPVAPEYAKAAATDDVDPSVRHLSVLEGSEVKVSVECTNKKRLTSAWLTVTSQQEPRRYPLTQKDGDGFVWSLTAPDTPFSRVTREIRLEIQVTDEDDLHLEAPIRGYIRIKADRPPTCMASVVHRVILPTAKPVVEYRASDDYGIAELALQIQIERAQNNGEIARSDQSAEVLAEQVEQLRELKEQIGKIVEQQSQVTEHAAQQPAVAHKQQQAIAEALAKATEETEDVPRVIESRLADAVEAVAASERALADGSAETAEEREEAVASAERAIEQAMTETSTQLADLEAIAPAERHTQPLLSGSQPILADQFPLMGSYELDLASIRVERDGQQVPAELVKGDRLKLTLETVDFRGDIPGESYQSDPLVLEISDESGVLAAISEADERSEQRLTDIIKQQLGIGESP